MPKTKFSKNEMHLMEILLVNHDMFQITNIYVNRLDFHGLAHTYEIIFKDSSKKLLRIVKESYTKPNIGCLRKQLEEYFK